MVRAKIRKWLNKLSGRHEETLEDLIAQINESNVYEEIDFGGLWEMKYGNTHLADHLPLSSLCQ